MPALATAEPIVVVLADGARLTTGQSFEVHTPGVSLSPVSLGLPRLVPGSLPPPPMTT